MIRLEIQHADQVAALLAQIAARLSPAMVQAASLSRRLLVEQLAAYPPAPGGSRYARTGALGRGWQRATPVTGGTGFQLINPVSYAGLVQGDDQAWMHQGRWRTVSAIAADLEPQVIAAYTQAIQQAMP